MRAVMSASVVFNSRARSEGFKEAFSRSNFSKGSMAAKLSRLTGDEHVFLATPMFYLTIARSARILPIVLRIIFAGLGLGAVLSSAVFGAEPEKSVIQISTFSQQPAWDAPW